MKTLEELKAAIKDIVESEDIETVVCDNLYLLDSSTNTEDFIERIEESINNQEVIYYSKAMNYLFDNDSSLQQSLQLASEYGYTVENLSSEILATILYQDNLRKSLYSLCDDIIAAIEDYNEEQENED